MFRDEQDSASQDLPEVIVLNSDDTSALIGNPLENENSWYTPTRDALCGFASGIGGAISTPSAFRLLETPLLLPGTAIVAFIGATLSTAAGHPKIDTRNFKAGDYIKCGVVGAVTILTTVGTATGGMAIIPAANITDFGVAIGVTVGASLASTVTAPLAGLLCGYGLFKARECITTLLTEKNDETIRPSLVINSGR